MADSIFSNWLSALQNLQSSVSKDLSEIRKQKAEIQQLKADILNEVARGKFIRDDERIVLSAPEIVIGNVDASGMLYGDSGTIVIRGQKLGLQGVGENGSVETCASLISQTAVDPGPDGIEQVVHSQSAIISQAINTVVFEPNLRNLHLSHSFQNIGSIFQLQVPCSPQGPFQQP